MKTLKSLLVAAGVTATAVFAFASPAAAHDGPDQYSGDNNGILNGLQVAIPVDFDWNVCGNSLAIFGETDTWAACWND